MDGLKYGETNTRSNARAILEMSSGELTRKQDI
jgi:hypothetical protein